MYKSSILSPSRHPFGRSGKCSIWSLDIESASPRADGPSSDVLLRAPVERGPESTRRIWKLYAPAYVLNDAPKALRKGLRQYFLRSDSPLALFCFSFSGAVGVQWAPSPHISMIFSDVANRAFLEGACLFDAPLRGPEGTGKVVRARWNGTAPGERFSSTVDPGEFREGAQAHSDRTDFVGGWATLPVVSKN